MRSTNLPTTRPRLAARRPKSTADGFQFLAGLALVFALFQWLGSALGSDRGQAGVVIGALITGAVLAVEKTLFGGSTTMCFLRLGLGRPAWPAVVFAFAVSLILVLVIPVYFIVTGGSFTMYSGWLGLLPGLFAQAGVAEEVLFRGYLFNHLRQGRTFWNAAFSASVPFVVVHLWLFWTLSWPIALASVALAAIISFPLAYAFELGGHTIWAPAVIHWTVQAGVKSVVAGEEPMRLALVWLTATAIVPFLMFFARPGEERLETR